MHLISYFVFNKCCGIFCFFKFNGFRMVVDLVIYLRLIRVNRGFLLFLEIESCKLLVFLLFFNLFWTNFLLITCEIIEYFVFLIEILRFFVLEYFSLYLYLFLNKSISSFCISNFFIDYFWLVVDFELIHHDFNVL
jgi:hypothetical protein